MIRTLRIYFLGRLLREKLLLVAFIAIGAVIWVSMFSGRAGSFWSRQKATSAELREQDRWLRDQASVEAAAAKAAEKLKPELTLDDTRLFTTVRRLGQESGIQTVLNQGREPQRTNGQFTINTVKIQAQATERDHAKNYENIVKFYVALQQQSPYIVIQQFILHPQSRSNLNPLTLTLTVSSVQIH